MFLMVGFVSSSPLTCKGEPHPRATQPPQGTHPGRLLFREPEEPPGLLGLAPSGPSARLGATMRGGQQQNSPGEGASIHLLSTPTAAAEEGTPNHVQPCEGQGLPGG